MSKSKKTKSLALFDVDNTIYDGFSYFSLLKREVEKGFIHGRSLYKVLVTMEKYKTGFIDYETAANSFLEIHAEELQGKSFKKAQEIAYELFASSHKFYPYVRNIIHKLKPSHHIIFVTAEPQYAAAAISSVLGGDGYFSTHFVTSQGKFNGKVSESLAYRNNKLEAIQASIKKNGVDDSIAFGDSESDIEMLGAVEHAICINPTSGLLKIAKENRWFIENPTTIERLIETLAV